MEIIQLTEEHRGFALLNKNDLPQNISIADLQRNGLKLHVLNFSAANGDGLSQCKEALARLVEDLTETAVGSEVVISRERHRDALGAALDALNLAFEGLRQRMPPEIVALDVGLVAESLGLITGEVSTEDILDAIFREFCIGK